MKTIAVTLLAGLAYCSAATADTGSNMQEWLWPIEGHTAGEEILYRPEQYIGDEHNYDNLFIGGTLGDRIVAPADGVISTLVLGYNKSLQYSMSYGYDSQEEVQTQIEAIAAEVERSIDKRYITGTIGIRLADGRTIYLSGLIPEKGFKTGQRISRGQNLGRLHYSYRGIPKPSLNLSVSDSKSRPADPMQPFGLTSTFIPPKSFVVKERLTSEEATADFNMIMGVLKEAYPSLDDTVTPEELAAFETSMLDSLAEGVSRSKFYRHLLRLQAKVHDSHIILYRDEYEARPHGLMPQISFGWQGDSCIVTMTRKNLSEYLGRRIVRINDMTSDKARDMLVGRIGVYDAQVESVIDEVLMFRSTLVSDDKNGIDVEFADGERLKLKGFRSNGNPKDFTDNYLGYLMQNYYRGENYLLRMLDDSTAYIGLNSFGLNEVETDDVVRFIDSVGMVPNMIIDVRNNGGGDIEVLNRLVSCFLDAPSRNRGACEMVTKRGRFASFKDCCMNYSDTVDIFPDYEPRQGLNGFYSTAQSQMVLPDPTVHYAGRIYVLTDAGSCSAATVFPAEIVRNRRGVVVGRETATAYHYMTALKFADIRLPNSGFQFRIPLVKLIYDTTENERVPYGRGVLPDYPVDVTAREIYHRPDSILLYAQQLIAEGRYLSDEDPFADADRPERETCYWWIYVLSGCVAATLCFAAVHSQKSKKDNRGRTKCDRAH